MCLCTPISSEMLAFELNADNTLEDLSLFFSPEDTASMISNKNVKFGQSILNEPWPTGHDGVPGPCLHMLPFCMIEL